MGIAGQQTFAPRRRMLKLTNVHRLSEVNTCVLILQEKAYNRVRALFGQEEPE